MSEIPYYFETPVPKYFRENGLFKNPKNLAFVTWCFERCSCEERIVFHDNQKITLKPYQFIFGRAACSEETGLTENEVRTQQLRWESSGFLKKTTNKTPNRFTIYEWVLTCFYKTDHQQNPRCTTNKPPTNHHNQEDKKIRSKEKDHPSIPSLPKDRMIDDFSSKIEIHKGIFLTKSELDDCIKIKGDIEKVKDAIEFIQNSKRRKHDITDWPNALARWKIENKAKTRIEDNIAYAEKLCKALDDFKKGHGWRCYMYHDRKKDQRGILFEPESAYQKAFFVSLVNGEFKTECENFMKEKKIALKK